jgi:hypothetical protein
VLLNLKAMYVTLKCIANLDKVKPSGSSLPPQPAYWTALSGPADEAGAEPKEWSRIAPPPSLSECALAGGTVETAEDGIELDPIGEAPVTVTRRMGVTGTVNPVNVPLPDDNDLLLHSAITLPLLNYGFIPLLSDDIVGLDTSVDHGLYARPPCSLVFFNSDMSLASLHGGISGASIDYADERGSLMDFKLLVSSGSDVGNGNFVFTFAFGIDGRFLDTPPCRIRCKLAGGVNGERNGRPN